MLDIHWCASLCCVLCFLSEIMRLFVVSQERERESECKFIKVITFSIVFQALMKIYHRAILEIITLKWNFHLLWLAGFESNLPSAKFCCLPFSPCLRDIIQLKPTQTKARERSEGKHTKIKRARAMLTTYCCWFDWLRGDGERSLCWKLRLELQTFAQSN